MLSEHIGRAGAIFLGRKGRHYRKILILILIVSSIPGIIIGGMIYWMAAGRLQKELTELHKNQIYQRAQNVDEQFSYLELSLAHWAFDPKFNYGLMDTDFVRDFETTRDITKTLLVMQGSHPLAKRVELYLHRPEPILLNPEYAVLENAQLAKSYDQLLSDGNTVYWSNLAADPNYPDKKDLTLVHKIPGGSLQPFGFILVRLDRDRIIRLLKTLTPYNQGETFIAAEDGTILVSAGTAAEPQPFDEALERAILSNKADRGSFLLNWNQTTYSVSYGKFTRIGSKWTYVSAAPIDAITAPVVSLSKRIVYVSLAVLLLAAVMSWLASRKIYSPLDRLIQVLTGGKFPRGDTHETDDEFGLIEREWQHLTRESMALQSRLEQQLPHVKEGFLLQLVQGYLYAYSEWDLRERMKHYGWTVDDRKFIVLYVQLTGFAGLEGRFSQGDEGLVTFAAANIIEELTSACPFQCDVINFHDLTVGVLVIVPNDRTYSAELHALSNDIMQAVNRILRMQATVTIGRSSRSIAQIPSLFEQAKQALSFRNFMNQNQIIDMERLEAAEAENDIRYPFNLEREVIQAMRTGQLQETERLVASFLHALSDGGAKEIDVQLGMLQLLGGMQHAMIHSGIHPNVLFKGCNMFEQLSQIREPERMLRWFQEKIVRPYIRELEARSDANVKKMIETAVIYLQNNYMNNISLDSCADFAGTNPYFLSKSFKQVTGKNFIDYLTDLRIGKAKELLRDTEMKMGDVAERVGYQHSYFNRIFKKQEGITPSQYRQMSRT